MRMGVQEDCCLEIPGTHACCTSRQSLGQQQIMNGITFCVMCDVCIILFGLI